MNKFSLARKSLLIVSLSAIGALSASIAPASAQTITTQFNLSDGFITGDFGDVTLTEGDFEVTFSGGQQQQTFDLPSYNVGPAGFLFINGGTGFTGTSGNTASATGDTGLIDFNLGVEEVSFFAANRANGAATTLNIFGVDDSTLLGSLPITQTSNQLGDGAVLTTLLASDFGGLIGSIEIDLPGPAANPPYVLAIDTFSATASTPEPAALVGLLAVVGVASLSKRQRTI
ncbi:MAG: PEP-CTERM sorting domain-containing protein [Cyanobacteria bacterium P01_H01_bin.15]